MASAPLRDLIDERTHIMPLTVRQYHNMIKSGILLEGEPYELLEGFIVEKDRSAAGRDSITVGHEHALVVIKLAKLSRRLERLGCHLRPQQPMTLPPHNEPEPDGLIVVGTEDDYAARHPRAKDALCVIEVSDASLRHDRGSKLRIYADAGIPCYVIINLVERTVEVYTEPLRGAGRYGQARTLTRRDRLTLPAAKGKQLGVPVRSLLM